jgi:uracil-DNA glycosylase
MNISLPPAWQTTLTPEMNKPYFRDLLNFVEQQYSETECFPAKKDIFRALELTDLDQVRVVILGQDPYHTPGAAMGLSFSIPEWAKIQPSLKNIFKELESDLGIIRTNSDLSDWAKQGVLLLNSTLTVRSWVAASHAGRGWETFTDAIIQELSKQKSGIVFVLWGWYAQSKRLFINGLKHTIINSPHPSPLSAYRGFLGSKPFSQINTHLSSHNQPTIQWAR